MHGLLIQPFSRNRSSAQCPAPASCCLTPPTDVFIAIVCTCHSGAPLADIGGQVVGLEALCAKPLAAWALQADGEAIGVLLKLLVRSARLTLTWCLPATVVGWRAAAHTFILVLQSSPIHPAGQRHQPFIASQVPTELHFHRHVWLPCGGGLAGMGSCAR